ncbi:MAG TPA: hypothetical protein ENK31_00330 [Nannocystis exedens]|nr:hypothetical protein [Nannocystis exedens]
MTREREGDLPPVDLRALPTIAEMLPHRPPMILIDAVRAFDFETITCTRRIRADEPYVVDGWVPAAVAIEYIAQTVATQRGLDGLLRGLPVVRGVLAACRSLDLSVGEFAVGDELTIKARALGQMAHIASFRGLVLRGGQVVAEAVIQVAELSDEAIPVTATPEPEKNP